MEQVLHQIQMAFEFRDDYNLICLVLVFLFICGGIVASFSGLVAHRLSKLGDDESIIPAIALPGSICESCGKKISIIALIPIFGWVISKGKGKCCGFKIPKKYPVSELIVGTLSASAPFVAGDFGLATLSLLIIIWSGTLISFIDIELHIIPEEITWILLFCGLFVSPLGFDMTDRVAGAALSALTMWVSLTATGYLMKQNTQAGGDVALAAVAGAWIAVSAVPTFLLVSSITYVAYSVPARMRGHIWTPMGPALVVGWLMSFIFPNILSFS